MRTYCFMILRGGNTCADVACLVCTCPLDELVQCDVQSTDAENNIQARLRVMWSKGQWTEQAKKSVVDLLNDCFHAGLPSFHKIEGTPFDLTSQVLCSGNYIYLGLEKGIRSRLCSDTEYAKSLDIISLTINVDGIPFANGAKRHMWPILAAFDDFPPPHYSSNVRW